MRAEIITFSGMLDATSTLRQKLEPLHPGQKIALQLFTNSKHYSMLYQRGQRRSKKLMLYIVCARKGFSKKETSDIGFILSE